MIARDLTLDQRWDALREARLPNFPRTTAFGRNDDGFDIGGDDGLGDHDESPALEDADYGDGAPGINFVGECVLEFAIAWQRFDSHVAAVVFNIDASLIAVVAPTPADYTGRVVGSEAIGDLVQLVSVQRSTASDAGSTGPTIAEVAALLNLSEQAIAEAVERHPWMLTGGERHGSPIIEHDGE